MTELEAKLVVLHDLTGGPVTTVQLAKLTTPDEWHVYAGPQPDWTHASAHRFERAIDELLDKLGGAHLVAETRRRTEARERVLAKAPGREVD